MHFLKLTLLAASASAAAIDARQQPEKPDWDVTNFSSEHTPHSSTAATSFSVSGPGFNTSCNHVQVTKSSNGLAMYRSVKCNDTAVTFGQGKVSGNNDYWFLSVHANRQTRYAIANASYFESPPGSGFEWQKFDLGPDFGLQPTLGG